jgi:hypothetical protein
MFSPVAPFSDSSRAPILPDIGCDLESSLYATAARGNGGMISIGKASCRKPSLHNGMIVGNSPLAQVLGSSLGNRDFGDIAQDLRAHRGPMEHQSSTSPQTARPSLEKASTSRLASSREPS